VDKGTHRRALFVPWRVTHRAVDQLPWPHRTVLSGQVDLGVEAVHAFSG
jgi:hypothetical protein